MLPSLLRILCSTWECLGISSDVNPSLLSAHCVHLMRKSLLTFLTCATFPFLSNVLLFDLMVMKPRCHVTYSFLCGFNSDCVSLIVSCSQWDTLGRRKALLKSYIHQISLWVCLSIILLLAILIRRHSPLWTVPYIGK